MNTLPSGMNTCIQIDIDMHAMGVGNHDEFMMLNIWSPSERPGTKRKDSGGGAHTVFCGVNSSGWSISISSKTGMPEAKRPVKDVPSSHVMVPFP